MYRDAAVKEVWLKFPKLFIVSGKSAGGQHHSPCVYRQDTARIFGYNPVYIAILIRQQLYRLMLGVDLYPQFWRNLKHFSNQIGAGPTGANGRIVTLQIFKLPIRIVDAQCSHGSPSNGKALPGFLFIEIHQPLKKASGIPQNLFHQRIRQAALCFLNAVFQKLFRLIRDPGLLMPAIVAGKPVVGQRCRAAALLCLFQNDHLFPGQLCKPDCGHQTAAACADDAEITAFLLRCMGHRLHLFRRLILDDALGTELRTGTAGNTDLRIDPILAAMKGDGLLYHDFPFYGEQLAFRDMDKIGSGAVACFYSETGDMASFKDFSSDEDFLLTAMAPVSKEKGDTIYMSDKKPSRADDVRWAVTTGCEDPELLISFIDYLYTDEGALLCNYGIEGETFEYDADGVPHFSDLINNNPTYDYRTAIFIYVMDSGPTVVDPMRGTGNYTQEQLDSWDQWRDADLDYSHVIPNKVVLEAEDAEYNSVKSDIETFLDEMTVKYITGEVSFDSYDTDFVEALKGMNAERMVELYQTAYDNYAA